MSGEDKLMLAAMQGMLQVNGAYSGRVDGVIGPMTIQAIKKSPEVAQKAADVTQNEAVLSVIDMALNGDKRVVDAIRTAAAEMSVDPNAFLAKAQIESGMNPLARNGSFRGLFQLGPAAWGDANKVIRSMGMPALPSYETGWSDPLQNSRAAMAYGVALTDQIRKLGWKGELSDSDMYLAHQQGAYGLVRIKRAAAGKRLDPSDASAMLKNMRSNAPQDGQGVTVDPREFLSRWESVYTQRYNGAV